MEALAPGGRYVVVVPEGLLLGSTKAHVDLRRRLMGDYALLAVISLPAGVFKPHAGVKTGVLVFRKPMANVQGTQKSGNVWFYEVRNDGYDPDKIVGGGRPETPEKNDIPDLLRQWKLYKESGFKNPPGVKTGTLLQAGSEEPVVGGHPARPLPKIAITWLPVAISPRWRNRRLKRIQLSSSARC